MLPLEFVVVIAIGTITPEASVEEDEEAAEDVLEDPDRVPAVMAAPELVVSLPSEFVLVAVVESGTDMAEEMTVDDTRVLPSELVVIPTVIGDIEDACAEDDVSEDDAAVEDAAEDESADDDARDDELDPEETAPDDEEEASDEEGASEEAVALELCPAEEVDAAEAESPEAEAEEDKLAVADTVEADAALVGAGELDWEDTLLLSPEDVLASELVAEADSVDREMAVVEESDTMIAAVEVADSDEESELLVEATVPLVVCLFLNSALIAMSCLAISISLEARFGFSP